MGSNYGPRDFARSSASTGRGIAGDRGRYRSLVEVCRRRFPHADIDFTYDTEISFFGGLFEVSVNGGLVHSKKKGMQFPDAPERLERIYLKIDSALREAAEQGKK
ncbi:hypothetical protein HXX76_008087 [Chlamydomonas incerta]|uniref:SelT/SelW/SelH family protein n=1 Tax=Chlamydomonas incerta TaxID=51695 RepID=A0A835W2L3_CHLIN|nr:hypothetical protein HXX76_008087 [Chlamydomonas incerta]|eukprot:KAG2433721.1 hypothetical protein HXX76_008087 [Chlamydomonas incerta]